MAQVKNFDSLYTELSQRAAERPDGSATVEAGEVWIAAEYQTNAELAEEISQLMYWTQVIMLARGITPDDIYKNL